MKKLASQESVKMQVIRLTQLLLQMGMLIAGGYLVYKVMQLFNGFDQMGDALPQIWRAL